MLAMEMLRRRIARCAWILFMVSLAACTKAPVSEFVRNNNELSINVFNELLKIGEDSFVFGIFCLDAIIALTCLGAGGDTAKEIKSAFNWNISDTRLTTDFEYVIKELKSIRNLNIHIANRIYLNHHISVDPKFLKIAEAFDTSIENVNFSTPQDATKKINSWVEKQNGGKTGRVAEEGNINTLTNMVLINSLYFQGRWKHPFLLNETKQTDFYISKNETVKIDMMKITGHFLLDINKRVGTKMLRIPYQNEKADMFLLLPDDVDGFHRIAKNARSLWGERDFKSVYTTVYLPKFKVKSSLDMIPIMKNMGVSKLFSSADLGGISKQNVSVSSVIQKNYLSIDEIGTESDDTVPDAGPAEKPIPAPNEKAQVFRADHPFVFGVLYDGFSLIAGRYSGPQAE
ncbi:hypothetical protein WA026_005628 [Henosepilachna vigintioctopunctata]|uniref:Serpin domain-containing protein n=1 Tax=Henosepilachna vigintioctopunctata TaxID=420089 RepID=A0AAW1U3T7_9CUCU